MRSEASVWEASLLDLRATGSEHALAMGSTLGRVGRDRFASKRAPASPRHSWRCHARLLVRGFSSRVRRVRERPGDCYGWCAVADASEGRYSTHSAFAPVTILSPGAQPQRGRVHPETRYGPCGSENRGC